MPPLRFSQQQHLQKAQHNSQLSAALARLAQPYLDWQVTTLFYGAVHLLQAYFVAKTNQYPQSHQERDELIGRDPHLTAIFADYRELKQLSVSCRYMCWPTNAHDVNQAQKHLATIRQHIENLLA
jgi:hypothetical protein